MTTRETTPPESPASQVDLMKDNAALNRTRHYSEIAQNYREVGVEWVLPDLDNEHDPLVLQLHEKLHTLPHVPQLQSANIEGRVLEGARHRFRAQENPNFRSIDGLISKRGPSVLQLKAMNEMGLNPVEQVIISRAVMIAVHSRIFSEESRYSRSRQQALFNRSKANLMHFASNEISVPGEEATEEDIEVFGARYSTAYLAAVIKREITTRGIETTETSVSDALKIDIPFGLLMSREEDDVISIFNQGDSQEAQPQQQGFREVDISTLDQQRIENLRELAEQFSGENSTFHVYESYSPFVSNHFRPLEEIGAEEDEEAAPPSDDERQTDLPPEERGEYTLIVIKKADEAERVATHVVADNPEFGNACYALRHEVLDHWKELTGLTLTWHTIFSYKRKIARQMGARPFIHNPKSDVKSRVNNYLRQESDSMVYETFGRIFDPDQGLFDEFMEPTSKNFMPKYMVKAIKTSGKLRELWSMIQDMGYVDTMAVVRAEMEVDKEQEDTEKLQPSHQLTAADILQGIINTRIKS